MLSSIKKLTYQKNNVKLPSYKKPMASRTQNRARNGLPEEQKMNTAVNECPRRFKNTSRDLPGHFIKEVMLDYMAELIDGGYPLHWRIEV